MHVCWFAKFENQPIIAISAQCTQNVLPTVENINVNIEFGRTDLCVCIQLLNTKLPHCHCHSYRTNNDANDTDLYIFALLAHRLTHSHTLTNSVRVNVNFITNHITYFFIVCGTYGKSVCIRIRKNKRCVCVQNGCD